MSGDQSSAADSKCPECGQNILIIEPNAASKTDGRIKGDWESRYRAPAARRAIRVEAAYVAITQILSIALTVILLVNYELIFPGLSDAKVESLTPVAFAYLGGFFGGSLFATKWLYHSVAKGIWNQDRLLWRLYTPLLSGGAALALVLLSSTSVVPIFGPEVMESPPAVFGISIVLGYFSDRVFSALEGFAKQNLTAKATTSGG